MPGARSDSELLLCDVFGLWTLLPLGDLELHHVTFLERLIPLALDGRIMNKHIGPGVLSDETIALGIAEPFHFPGDA